MGGNIRIRSDMRVPGRATCYEDHVKQPPEPYSLYLLARLCHEEGRKVPVAKCGTDPRLLFAALLGREDGARALVDPRFPIPTKENFDRACAQLMGTLLPLTHLSASRLPAARTKPTEGASILDGMLDEFEEKRA